MGVAAENLQVAEDREPASLCLARILSPQSLCFEIVWQSWTDLWTPGIFSGAGRTVIPCLCQEQWDALPDPCSGLEGEACESHLSDQ